MTKRTRGKHRGPARSAGSPRRDPARAPERPPVAPLPAAHPLALAVALVAALGLVVSVSFRIYDTDFWQHLLVGRIVWETLRIPTTQIWTWPTFGAPDVNSSWGFEALVWPFWRIGEFPGLFVWRWLSTLAAFALLWRIARGLGARGLTTFVVIALAGLVYRQRSQIRPETWVAILMSLEILILEIRRRGGPDRTWWIVPIAWVWANCHISYHFGLMLLGVYALDDLRAGRDARRLGVVAGLALAVSFANPFGWRALWQPFEYFLFWRHEAIFQIISELGPIDWSLNLRNGLPVLLAAWPLLLLWRWRRAGLDVVELLLCAVFLGLAFLSQRFLGFYALACVPWLARDLDEWVRARRWPAWTEPPAARAALAAATCVVIALPEWTSPDPPLGIGLLEQNYPIAAADWIERHDVRGRSFNQMRSGGYLVWRFWPERERLPFIDVHQAGTPEIRRLYVEALVREEGWKALDQRFRFEWALLSRPPPPGDRMQDFLDRDTSYALVFVDDAAALYLRRAGPLATLAARFEYRELGAGEQRLLAVAERCAGDSALRERVRAELRRQIADSRHTALAHSFLANLALSEQRWDEAQAQLDTALAKDPRVPDARLRIATVALARGDAYAAIDALEWERRHGGGKAVGVDVRLGLAYEQLGDVGRARAAYRRALKREPSNPHVAEALRRLESRGR